MIIFFLNTLLTATYPLFDETSVVNLKNEMVPRHSFIRQKNSTQLLAENRGNSNSISVDLFTFQNQNGFVRPFVVPGFPSNFRFFRSANPRMLVVNRGFTELLLLEIGIFAKTKIMVSEKFCIWVSFKFAPDGSANARMLVDNRGVYWIRVRKYRKCENFGPIFFWKCS